MGPEGESIDRIYGSAASGGSMRLIPIKIIPIQRQNNKTIHSKKI